MFTNDDECGPQRAGRYLDNLLADAALAARSRHGRSSGDDWGLCVEVLTVLARRDTRADASEVYEKVDALDERGLATLVEQCRKCVWDAHFSQVWPWVSMDNFRLLEKLFR